MNFIPDTLNPTPDYYCTWQTQLYATNDGKPDGQRAIVGEKALFSEEKPFGWAYFYEQARPDLFLVMDDSWDVPVKDDPSYYGSLILNEEKFPNATSNTSSNAEALKNLSDRVKALGWKGLGGWICAQESERFVGCKTPEEYWTERMIEADKSGFAYWKVDWGKKGKSIEFRNLLTELGRKTAPNLIIEHAMKKEVIPCSDVYRTYDVPAIMSIPMTMEKIEEFITVGKVNDGYMGLINCEDEAYIAAAGGFVMGVMRHPYDGDFMNGKADMSFPKVHRNLKTKMYEIIRAARWHRIAPAFGIDNENVQISSDKLTDTWRFNKQAEEIEEWWLKSELIKNFIEEGVLTKSAPACISRNSDLPIVSPDENGAVPYIVAAKNPNGVFSVVTAGRTLENEYKIPKCDVYVNVGNSDTVGAFGEYKNLIIETSNTHINSIYMQDIADEIAVDVSDLVKKEDNKIIISGELINKIGTKAQPEADTSEPGVVIKFL